MRPVTKLTMPFDPTTVAVVVAMTIAMLEANISVAMIVTLKSSVHATALPTKERSNRSAAVARGWDDSTTVVLACRGRLKLRLRLRLRLTLRVCVMLVIRTLTRESWPAPILSKDTLYISFDLLTKQEICVSSAVGFNLTLASMDLGSLELD